MNRKLWVTAGALTCAAILWTSGILVGSWAAADETPGTLTKIQSSANESNDAAQEATMSSSANPLAGTGWRLVEFQSMDDATGTILDNLGCQRAEGRIWCDVQQLGGGPRGYVAAEYLTAVVSPDGSVATGPDNSAFRAGQGDFDATGQIPCAQSVGQPMMQCDFGVARAGGGYATVVIKKSDGRTRAIFFSHG